ncbi:MAG: cupin domain-containing protein [Proteobacteria bacterium]|nr:cupin domain-containing protein [Pseudomonadota bacterium]
MSRPHIDFVQSQSLPWQPSPWPHLRGCELKILSRDAEDGAWSLLVRFPPRWAQAAVASLAADEEFLVVDGHLVIDGRHCEHDSYGWIPAGCRHGERRSPEGAVALVFYSAEPAPAAEAPAAAVREPRLVDGYELAWATEGLDAAMVADGRRAKWLRPPGEGQGATLLLSAPPHLRPPGWRGTQERHPGAEELFVLAGDLVGRTGELTSGAYRWSPAGVAHGPYGSRGGCLAVLRTHGMGLATERTPYELEIVRSPAYQPVLPEALQSLGTRGWRPLRY